MSKIQKAIHNINYIDELAREDRWVNKIHPSVKLFLTIAYIAVVVSFNRFNIIGLAAMSIYPIIIFLLSELSIKESIWRLRVVLPLVCFVGIFNIFADKREIYSLGGIVITMGMVSMVNLMLKGIFAVLAGYLLIATTTIEKLCYGLRVLRVPQIIVTVVLLTYRYISLLLKEVNIMTQAYSLRAPKQNGINYRLWGTMIGQLLIRSMDRAEGLYNSMCIRGYNGEFIYSNKYRFSVKDGIYLLLWLTVFFIFRLFPVFKIVGSLIKM